MKQLLISTCHSMVWVVAALWLVGCTSVVHNQNGTWDVPRQVESRSLLGTNQAGMRIDNCKREVYRFITPNEYIDCTELVPYGLASSQGQGGQIISGGLMGLGFGLGAAHGGGSQTVNQPITTSTLNLKK